MSNGTYSMKGIAVIGLAGRFPGAKNVDQFWKNLRDGVESISRSTDDELAAQGIPPATLNDPNYVKAGAVLEDVEMFDATFFDISPGEAEIMDPQHRLFLEAAWIALENAGYNPENYRGLIGIYAGNAGMIGQSGTMNDHMFNLYFKQKTNDITTEFHKEIGNEKDYLATRVSYKLNLKGPSFTVQAACATSLVAVHLACQSLLNYECDIALAGGVTINPPQTKGYFYKEGMIPSPDGHCRAFDAKAQGTVFGQGLGIVVLKRLSEAMADGDTIHAVIKGSAINNDGACKRSYAAPSIDGQAEVTKAALALAEIDPDTITYIETHGTGTSLGDPVEIAALTKAFRTSTQNKGFCAIGSLKTNIGHLGPTCGVAALIKTILALEHKEIPPSLHFEKPNPKIDFENSPFYVNTKLKEWQSNGTPRRAGVSAFGVGGTNAHVVLEEAPVLPPSDKSRPYQLLVLSGKTNSALETASGNLLTHLKHHPNLNLTDVAYTLQVGRKAFSKRRMLVCTDRQDAISALEKPDRHLTSTQQPEKHSVGFLFTGQGAQYVNMGLEIYQHEATFRNQVNDCVELLRPHLGLDLRHVLYPSEESEEATTQLNKTALAQPALFVIEYALAKLWMSWGIKPQAMIGHSIGEYVAACLAGVFSLQEALALVAARGRMMQDLPAGSMLAVFMPSKEIVRLLSEDDQMAGVSLAAINGPSLCVVSGPTDVIKTVKKTLSEKGLECQRLHTSHAFHSPIMDPIVEQFTEEVKKVKLSAPTIPYISNLTGRWITETEATDPTYWGRHLRETVRFSDGVQELLKESKWNLLELGPGKTLCTLVRQHSNQMKGQLVASCLRHPKEQQSDLAFLLTAVGSLWLSGVEIDWVRFYANERRQRIPLSTYPFERQRYWVGTQSSVESRTAAQEVLYKEKDISKWFYVPSWKRCPLSKQQGRKTLSDQKSSWLVFLDECGLGAKLVNQLQQDGQRVMTVKTGTKFSQASEEAYTICPQAQEDYNSLLQELRKAGRGPNTIVHLWNLTSAEGSFSDSDFLGVSQNMGFKSLLFLVQAIDDQLSREPIQIKIISNHLQDVTGEEVLIPEKATLLGPCLVTSQEYPNIQCTSVDIVLPKADAEQERLLELLMGELSTKTSESIVAYRGKYRWVQTFEPIRLEKAADLKPRIRKNGVYLITGGFGGIGLTLAEYLAKTVQAKLVLIARTILPARDEWDEWLKTHDDQDTISRKIRKVQSIEELGADVLLLSADVTDVIQMQAAIKKTHDRFGAINGVVHAAGIAGAGLMQLKTPELVQTVLAPKVKGTLVLDKLLSDLDFFALSSSISSLLGGVGQVDYCAANAFLDAYAHQHHSRNTCISINWCAWQEVGMAVNTAVPDDLREEREQSLKLGILPEEGKEAFSRILGSSFPQVVVSTQDFLHQVELGKNATAQDPVGIMTKASSRKSTYARPNLSSVYVVPSNTTEQTVAEIWQQVLAVEKVGIHDNFFDLGGHSLLVAQVVALLRKALPVDFRMGILFEKPTVHLLSQMILDEREGGPSFAQSSSRGQKRKERRLKGR